MCPWSYLLNYHRDKPIGWITVINTEFSLFKLKLQTNVISINFFLYIFIIRTVLCKLFAKSWTIDPAPWATGPERNTDPFWFRCLRPSIAGPLNSILIIYLKAHNSKFSGCDECLSVIYSWTLTPYQKTTIRKLAFKCTLNFLLCYDLYTLEMYMWAVLKF